MTELVFVDTNVLIYAVDSRDREKQRCASEWMNLLWRERRGRTSFQVLSEFHVNVTKKLRPGLTAGEAWACVDELCAWSPQPLDQSVFSLGRQIEARYRLSWWDAMIVAAAEVQGCEKLLSEDFQHGSRIGRVTVCNPFRAAVAEPAASHGESGLRPLPRHRARGRPPKRRSAGA